jgi:aspartate 1-decarboxylase
MQRTLLLAKIHSCTLTAANLNYVGSISIDRTLLDAAGILPYEQVQVVNVANGERFITYAIAAPANSGAIELNGAAARLGVPGDRLIIMTYAQLSQEELKSHSPTVVLVDEKNRLLEVRHYDDLLSSDNVAQRSKDAKQLLEY